MSIRPNDNVLLKTSSVDDNPRVTPTITAIAPLPNSKSLIINRKTSVKLKKTLTNNTLNPTMPEL